MKNDEREIRKRKNEKAIVLEHHGPSKKQVNASSLQSRTSISQKSKKSKEDNDEKYFLDSNYLRNPFSKPFVRDIYYAYLINGARRTKQEGYPIVEGYMVSDELPKEIFQWDQRSQVKDKSITGISFYSPDKYLNGIINNPVNYIQELSEYQVVLGMDASPYDNMPPVVQKSQIFNKSFLDLFLWKYWIKSYSKCSCWY